MDCKRVPGTTTCPPLPRLRYDCPSARAVQPLHCQLMLDRGVLDNCAFYASCAPTEAVLRECAGILDEVLSEVAAAVKAGEVERRLRGWVGAEWFCTAHVGRKLRRRAR